MRGEHVAVLLLLQTFPHSTITKDGMAPSRLFHSGITSAAVNDPLPLSPGSRSRAATRHGLLLASIDHGLLSVSSKYARPVF